MQKVLLYRMLAVKSMFRIRHGDYSYCKFEKKKATKLRAELCDQMHANFHVFSRISLADFCILLGSTVSSHITKTVKVAAMLIVVMRRVRWGGRTRRAQPLGHFCVRHVAPSPLLSTTALGIRFVRMEQSLHLLYSKLVLIKCVGRITANDHWLPLVPMPFHASSGQ